MRNINIEKQDPQTGAFYPTIITLPDFGLSNAEYDGLMVQLEQLFMHSRLSVRATSAMIVYVVMSLLGSGGSYAAQSTTLLTPTSTAGVCQKCSSPSTLRWCVGCDDYGEMVGDHIHRLCSTCGFAWLERCHDHVVADAANRLSSA